eukprot:1055731-Prorocentrum_minimum.AAC.2
MLVSRVSFSHRTVPPCHLTSLERDRVEYLGRWITISTCLLPNRFEGLTSRERPNVNILGFWAHAMQCKRQLTTRDYHKLTMISISPTCLANHEYYLNCLGGGGTKRMF